MRQLIFCMVVMSLTAIAGFAQEPPPPPDMPPPPGVERGMGVEKELMRMCETLDLTAEQKESMEAAQVEAQKAIIPIKAEIELKQIDFRTEMKKDNPDRAKVMKIAKEINDLEWKIKQTDIDKKLGIHSILTPEQREKMKNSHRKMIINREKFEMKYD
ncbi:MAG TPA: periplasmic heavy metal sensor [bacterium]